MRILGIDPGIGRTGWGVIEMAHGKWHMANSGCIETLPKSATPGRLEALYDEVAMIIKEYQPQELAIEELFFNTNVTTALTVGQARGVILLAASKANILIVEYTPLQVKQSLTGYGRAEKKQMGQMVKVLLGLQNVPKPDDIVDALAIALTHAYSRKMMIGS